MQKIRSLLLATSLLARVGAGAGALPLTAYAGARRESRRPPVVWRPPDCAGA
jgi:hypothetical protein